VSVDRGVWKNFNLTQTPPYHLTRDELTNCYYAREYNGSGGFQSSPTNQLIFNFKKPPSKKDSPYEWDFKIRAIGNFAKELSLAFSTLTAETPIAFIPTSKTKENPEYDDRFEQVLARLVQLQPKLKIVEPIVPIIDRPSFSKKESARDVNVCENVLSWRGFGDDYHPRHLIIIDDVISSGCNYKAYMNVLSRNYKGNIRVYGFFWAKTV